VAGRRGAVVEDDFYNKLERLNVQAGKKDKILLALGKETPLRHQRSQKMLKLYAPADAWLGIQAFL